jgi:hypothetical protein
MLAGDGDLERALGRQDLLHRLDDGNDLRAERVVIAEGGERLDAGKGPSVPGEREARRRARTWPPT